MRFLIVLASLAQEYERADRDERCIECHIEDADQVRGSVHGAANVGCVGCHGTDDVRLRQPRGNPHRKLPTFRGWRRQDIPEDCGACHQAELEALKLGGHYAATKLGADQPRHMDGCLACHHHHGTARAVRGELLKSCANCHGAAEVGLGREFAEFMDGLDRPHGDLAALVRRLERSPGIDVRPAKEHLAADAEALHRLRVSQHGLRFAELSRAPPATTAPAAGAYNRLAEDERRFGRRGLVLLPFLALVAAGIVLIRMKAHDLGRGPEA